MSGGKGDAGENQDTRNRETPRKTLDLPTDVSQGCRTVHRDEQ